MPYQSAPCSSLSCWTSSAGLIALFEIRGPHLTRVNMVAGALALATTPCPMTKKAGCTRGSVHRSPNTHGEDGNLLKGPHDGPDAHMAASQSSPGSHAIRLSAVPLELLSGGYGRDEDLTAGG